MGHKPGPYSFTPRDHNSTCDKNEWVVSKEEETVVGVQRNTSVKEVTDLPLHVTE